MKNGEPVEVDFIIVVEFALADSSGGPVARLETPVAGPEWRGHDARLPGNDGRLGSARDDGKDGGLISRARERAEPGYYLAGPGHA